MDADEQSSERVEALLAQCIERWGVEGKSCVERVTEGDRGLAERLHARLAALDRLGLLAAPPVAPRSIGRFQIQRELGRGGMGVVYLAIDERLDRRVAIKIGHLPRAPSSAAGFDDPATRASVRFEREIKAAAQLEHSGIVRIYDVGDVDGRPYFAMEYIEGATLSSIVDELRARSFSFADLTPELLRDFVSHSAGVERSLVAPGDTWGRTYIEIACRWIIAVADALAHAHAHGIVHRDVKPANVIIRLDGTPKVFDLGLARLEDQPSMTRSGEIAGSPYYVSPEQLAGAPDEVDRRADVYSLGVTLFELLTLRRPFEGPTTAQVFRQIQSKEPPLPRRLNPLVPRDLERICLAALEKDPSRRYQTMDELAADLRRFLEFQPVRAKPVSLARRALRFVRHNPARAAAIGLAATVIVGLPAGLLLANAAVRSEQSRTAAAAARARHEAVLKAKVTEYLVKEFELTDEQREHAGTISARELLDRGVERLENEFADQPDVRAALFEALGRSYHNLGLSDRAIPLFDRALAVRQSLSDTDPLELAALFDRLAAAHLATGDGASAVLLAERGLASLAGADAQGSAGELAAGLESTLADAYDLNGEFSQAREHLARALELDRATLGAESTPVSALLARLGRLDSAHGDLARADDELARALELERRAWAPDPRTIAGILIELASVAESRGDPSRSLDLRSQASRFTADAPLDLGLRPPFEVEPSWRARYETEFQGGITALQLRKGLKAVEHFMQCLTLSPRQAVCAYNVACGYAIADDVDRGLEWLERAVEFGFALTASRVQTFDSDGDLAVLRADPRYAAIRRSLDALSARVVEFAKQTALVIPDGASAATPTAVLVALHDDGATCRALADGPWARATRGARAALVAPSGAFTSQGDPELGMRWLEEPRDLLTKPASFESRVTEALRDFSSTHAVDRRRVWIGGEGAGAMLAFELAARAPGLFKGVVILDGPIHPETQIARARRAASMGLLVRVILDQSRPWFGRAKSVNVAKLGEDLSMWFEQCGFGERARVRVVDSAADPQARDRALAEVVKELSGG